MACTTCSIVRRTFVGLGVAGLAYWKLSGHLPSDQSENAWRGFLWVIVGVLIVSVFIRMRQMSKRWKR